MKLRSILIGLMLFTTIIVKSQAFWILILGDKISNDFMESGINFSISRSNYSDLDRSNAMYSWALGGFMDFKIKDGPWNIALDMTFKSPTGASNLNNYYNHYPIIDTGIVTDNIKLEGVNFAIPIYLKYKTKYVNFGIGPQFNFLYKASFKYEAETTDNFDVRVTNNAKNFVKMFDVGISGVIETYLFPNKPETSLRIGLRYYYGFISQLKDYPGANSSVFLLSFGIPIVGKKTMTEK